MAQSIIIEDDTGSTYSTPTRLYRSWFLDRWIPAMYRPPQTWWAFEDHCCLVTISMANCPRALNAMQIARFRREIWKTKLFFISHVVHSWRFRLGSVFDSLLCDSREIDVNRWFFVYVLDFYSNFYMCVRLFKTIELN